MRPSYLSITLALAAGAWWAVSREGTLDPTLAGIGLAVAWLIQAVAFVTLTRALESGGSAVRPWVLGMTARGAGLAVLWIAARAIGIDGFDLVVPYALALLAFLLLEAGWLAASSSSRPQSKSTSTE